MIVYSLHSLLFDVDFSLEHVAGMPCLVSLLCMLEVGSSFCLQDAFIGLPASPPVFCWPPRSHHITSSCGTVVNGADTSPGLMGVADCIGTNTGASDHYNFNNKEDLGLF